MLPWNILHPQVVFFFVDLVWRASNNFWISSSVVSLNLLVGGGGLRDAYFRWYGATFFLRGTVFLLNGTVSCLEGAVSRFEGTAFWFEGSRIQRGGVRFFKGVVGFQRGGAGVSCWERSVMVGFARLFEISSAISLLPDWPKCSKSILH